MNVAYLKGRIMRVLLTGQVGLDKASYLKAAAQICVQHGMSFETASIGRMIVEGASGNQTDATILNLPKNELQALRKIAWESVLSLADQANPEGAFVVNSHAVLRWHHGPVPALELNTLLRLRPEMLVTLIDDVDLVKKGLASRGTDVFQLWELLAWREEEIYITRLMGESLARLTGTVIPFYLVAKKQGPELFATLLMQGTSRKAYLSFPVTGLSVSQKDEVDRFKKELSSKLICFDPLALSERSIVSRASSLAEETSNAFKPGLTELFATTHSPLGAAWITHLDEFTGLGLVKLVGDGERLLGREVLSVMDAIDSQIIARDFLLIEQSDMIVAYIPADDIGNPRISAGSQSEVLYAYQNGKGVYIVFPGDSRKLSPWVTEFASASVFATVDECIARLSV